LTWVAIYWLWYYENVCSYTVVRHAFCFWRFALLFLGLATHYHESWSCGNKYIWLYALSIHLNGYYRSCIRCGTKLTKPNPRWQPKNGCDGRLIAKFLTMTIQVNLCRIWHQIVIIKNFAINLPSQPFLGRHFGFHIFLSLWPFWGCTLFFCNWAVLD